jgi:hypothetical protein
MNDDEEMPWQQNGFIWVNYLNPYNEFAEAYQKIQDSPKIDADT